MKISSYSIIAFLIIIVLGISIISFISQESYSLRSEDYDLDGIPDSLDSCPRISETYNKFEDTDGCPDSVPEKITKYEFPDTDGDGIEDRLDSCIDKAENFNGYLDHDGCPEIVAEKQEEKIDSDLDSIPDSKDACPFDKENFNNIRDSDGCPDESESLQENISDFEDDCRGGEVMVIRSNHNDSICVPKDTADKWAALGIAVIVKTTSLPTENTITGIETTAKEISEGHKVLETIQTIDPYFNTRPELEKQNIETVLLLLSSFSPWDMELASSVLSENYVEHNPTMPSDKQGALAFLNETLTSIPSESIKLEVQRIYADNDYVIAHSHFHVINKVNVSLIDIFELSKGKIIEHWDVIQDIPETSIKENTMFYLD